MFTSVFASGRTRAIRLASSAAIITTLAAGTIVLPAHAAVPAASPVPGLQSALSRAANYQIDLKVSTGGSSASATKGTIVAVRKGGALQLYLHLTVTAAGQTQTVVATVAGSKVCVRASGKTQCKTDPTLARQLSSTSSVSSINAATTFTPLAGTTSITINGSPQECSAYAFITSTSEVQTRGALYVLPATGQPCEIDATTRAMAGGQSVTVTTTAVWSRFNDPSLTIPSA